MLYKGSTKIGSFQLGSTKIGKLYKGSTLVYSSSAYKPDEVIFESSTAGTYSLELLETGKYEVTCVAGGASGLSSYDSGGTAFSASGASGACFVGLIQFNKLTNLNITVGNAGSFTTRNASPGGITKITDVVTCPSQKGYGHNSRTVYNENNGSPTVHVTPITTTVNKAGNNGDRMWIGYFRQFDGGKSSYDDTLTGFGAGGNCSSSSGSGSAGKPGYVKIVYKGK